MSPTGAEPDRIEVRGLVVEAVHGVRPEERRAPQPFEVDLDIEVAPSSGDDLGTTADYASAVDSVLEVLARPPRALLETLAEEMAAAVLADERALKVTVSVRKLRPPLDAQLSSAGVRLTRTR